MFGSNGNWPLDENHKINLLMVINDYDFDLVLDNNGSLLVTANPW